MTTTPITIRRATLNDAAMLSQLGARLFEATFRGTCSEQDMQDQLAAYYNQQQVERELADQEDYFFLVSQSDEIAGYSRMKKGNPPSEVTGGRSAIELKRLYLDQRFHGLGLAQILMNHNLELARSIGCQRVYLSVWEFNDRAKAFYSKVGFRGTGIANPFPIGETPQTDHWYIMDL